MTTREPFREYMRSPKVAVYAAAGEMPKRFPSDPIVKVVIDL